jgi:hypothetical protein
MSEWPVIDDAELLERLALTQDGFHAYVRRLFEAVPPRAYEEAALEYALGYPWERPPGSYRLAEDGAVEPLAELGAGEREGVVRSFAAAAGRQPLLAIGSNAAPAALRRKFAHFEEAGDRTVLVLTGRLHEFDVGAAPQPAIYGAMPATIFPSPGTRVAAALLWVTPAQFTQLTWSEVGYRLGRLRTRFEVAETADTFDEVLVFVSRFGAFCVDGEPVALAAIPATGRTAIALTQRQLLDAAAVLALGEDADAEALVRASCEGMGALAARVAETVWLHSRPFASERWTPFPADAAPAPGAPRGAN